MRCLLRRAWVALLLGAASCGDGGGSGIPGGAPTAAPIPAPAPTLGVPGELRVSATGSDFIEWSWEAVEGAASYEIQVSTVAGDFGAAMATTVTATMHRFAVAPGMTAHARVRALAEGVESDWSAAVMGTSDAAPVTVSFVGESLRVEEGETAPVEIRVQVAELAAPLSLEISPLAVTAEAEDYELSATVIEIPAGSGGDETTALSFTAVRDRAIAEGEETLVLRFVPPEGGLRATGRRSGSRDRRGGRLAMRGGPDSRRASASGAPAATHDRGGSRDDARDGLSPGGRTDDVRLDRSLSGHSTGGPAGIQPPVGGKSVPLDAPSSMSPTGVSRRRAWRRDTRCGSSGRRTPRWRCVSDPMKTAARVNPKRFAPGTAAN